MTSPESIVDEFSRTATLANFREIGRLEISSENVAQVELVDERGGIYRFETNGEKYRLRATDFEFLEFEYDDSERMGMARDLARVGRAVYEGNYTTDRRGDIEVVVDGRYYGGLRRRQGRSMD